MPIRKRNIGDEQIDGAKLLLLNNQSVKAKKNNGASIDLFKLDAADDFRLNKIPLVSEDPTTDEQLSRKKYVDDSIAAIPQIHYQKIDITATDVSNGYVDLDILANSDSVLIAVDSRLLLLRDADYTLGEASGVTRVSFIDQPVADGESLFVWSFPVSGAGGSGSSGVDGKSVLSGSGAPNPALGRDGEFYINKSAFTIYGPKTSGSWGLPTSLIGPQGVKGDTGEQGPAGPQGEPGTGANIEFANETPTGDVDGVNDVFTVSSSPAAAPFIVWVNGLQTSAFSRSGLTFTMDSPPAKGQSIYVMYLKG